MADEQCQGNHLHLRQAELCPPSSTTKFVLRYELFFLLVFPLRHNEVPPKGYRSSRNLLQHRGTQRSTVVVTVIVHLADTFFQNGVPLQRIMRHELSITNSKQTCKCSTHMTFIAYCIIVDKSTNDNAFCVFNAATFLNFADVNSGIELL